MDDLHELVRGAYPFRDLSREQLENVLDMLAGRYPPTSSPSCGRASSGTAPRGSSAAASGARRLAVTNAGTIPDRGLFGVHLVDGGGRVGELDEEMVYEARAGRPSCWAPPRGGSRRSLATGCSSRRRRVCPGAVPVLEGRGRRQAVRARRGDRRGLAGARALADEKALDAARRRSLARRAAPPEPAHLPARAGSRDRRRPVRPHRGRRAFPRRDRRLAGLHPDPVRRAGARALGDGLAARLRDSLGIEVQSLWSDDGIALPPARRRRAAADRGVLIEPDELEDLVVQEVGQTRALRRALPRERRPRAPDPAPAARPAHAALAAAAEGAGTAAGRPAVPGFPIVLETYRECLQDVFDLPALKGCCGGSGRVSSTSSTSRRRPPPRTRPHCSSTTSPRTCTRTTRRRPNGARRRSRSTATCSASCSARRSCATSSTRGRSRTWRASCGAIRARRRIARLCADGATCER